MRFRTCWEYLYRKGSIFTINIQLGEQKAESQGIIAKAVQQAPT
jgi:hypothetical protein